MKKYIKAEAYAFKESDDLYGCYLRSSSGSLDDILVFSEDRKAAIDYGEYVAGLFRKATDPEFRTGAESGQLADAIFKNPPAGVFLADDYYAPYSFYLDDEYLVVNDAKGNIFNVIPARIIRGEFYI